MRVRDLIEKLKQFDDLSEVFLIDDRKRDYCEGCQKFDDNYFSDRLNIVDVVRHELGQYPVVNLHFIEE